jgi:hypothetical protein
MPAAATPSECGGHGIAAVERTAWLVWHELVVQARFMRSTARDAAALIDGASPLSSKPKVKTKPHLQGFIASVACTP